MSGQSQSQSQPEVTLKKLRQDLGFSQEELGRRIGCSFRSIAEWEAGRQIPRLDKALALARELKVSVKTLADIMRLDIEGVPDDILQ